ncbi:LysR family transcriptional regulator [Streptomyces sp. NPDC029526]|uniref:LysR family transcriptional regulator n=1 Tax=Streptomyces sp. NPDC029526 TaxID=3155728 RepID=UPI0033F59ED6
MLDLRRLRLLRELHRRGTIAAVAEALTFTASAVSQQLGVLEREAGVPLLERSGRRVTLTPAGRTLVTHADAVLERLELAVAELAGAREGIGGPLRIGTFPSGGPAIVPATLAELARQHPALEPMVQEIDSARVSDGLRAGELDVALVHDYDFVPAPPDTAVDQVPLLEEPMYLATGTTTATGSTLGAGITPGAGTTAGTGITLGAGTTPGTGMTPGIGTQTGTSTGASPADTPPPAPTPAPPDDQGGVEGVGPAPAPLRGGATQDIAAQHVDARGHTLADLLGPWATAPWITARDGTTGHAMAVRACQAAGFQPRIRHQVNDFRTVLALAAHGQGAGFVPEMATAQPPEGVVLTRLPLYRRSKVAFRAGGGAHPAIAAFVTAARTAVGTAVRTTDQAATPPRHGR